MARLIDYLKDAVTQPREELTRRQHQVRYAWELVVHCGRQLLRHRAEGMAAELTYRTIFALIPLVVLGLVLFRIVGGLEDVQSRVENQLYSFFGVPDIPAEYSVEVEPLLDSPPDEAEVGESEDNGPADGEAERREQEDQEAERREQEDQEAERRDQDDQEAEASIRRILSRVADQIWKIDFRSIGVVGLLLFIYAAVALADSTEDLFNRIFDAPRQRPIHIRIAIHWSIITLGTGLLALSLYLTGQFIDWFRAVGPGWWSTWILAPLLSALASWVLLFLVYALMPNTHVSVKAAAVGAAVSAVLWEAAKAGFQTYVATAVPYSALYGSLGLIPLFLFWIYLTWWIVLFGIILTHSLQTLRGRRPVRDDAQDDLPHGDPDWMLPIMVDVAQAFERGNAIEPQDLADHLGLSGRIVQEMVGYLIEAGLLRRVDADSATEHALTLAKPAKKISLREILELGHRHRPKIDHPAWRQLNALKQAEFEAAGDKTLADIDSSSRAEDESAFR